MRKERFSYNTEAPEERARSAGEKYADKGGHGLRHELTDLSRKAHRAKGQLPEELIWEIRKYQLPKHPKTRRA